MSYYAIDFWGCVHFGRTPAEAAKKAREAESDGDGDVDLDDLKSRAEFKATEEERDEEGQRLNL
ncbi:hypothetical protein J7J41_01555 [bacterium]|nr:hypothetical protein [bacterium]